MGLTTLLGDASLEAHKLLIAMSEEQLAALLAKLKDDAVLQAKLKGAADLDAFLALAVEAGFDVGKADWLNYQSRQTIGKELSDEELGAVVGGWTVVGVGLREVEAGINGFGLVNG